MIAALPLYVVHEFEFRYALLNPAFSKNRELQINEFK